MSGAADARARLAAVEAALARLAAQHEVAMSAFRFDEASALQGRIAILETERRALAAAVPAPPPANRPPSGIVPVLARPRRTRRR